jgi:murein DD-endopeptidase MepM/ murein hydrolase activator NlpD
LIPGEGIIRDLPPGMDSLELSLIPAQPGVALGVRGTLAAEAMGTESLNGALDGLPLAMTTQEDRFVGVVGTGAFYAGGSPELQLQVGSSPPWVQPWTFAEREWEYQDLTLTGEAAAIDQQARDEERARLRELWANVTPPRWTAAFQTPIADFLEVSANYGARRSYNGGPYLTYHEGVDFSAYAGTPVYAPAAGTVVLAERLYVRGGAVIIDHGLGIFSGYYHLSAVHAQAGQQVFPGDLLGEVGTTGLSTGNHLHWDMLVNSIWVDAAAWQQQNLACWLLEGLGQACAALTS